MPVRCDVCGKGPQFGNTVSHSKRHTARRWLPNIQQFVVRSGPSTKRLNVCSRCLRTLRKA
jgi:large subunit ribosomal protein L28